MKQRSRELAAYELAGIHGPRNTIPSRHHRFLYTEKREFCEKENTEIHKMIVPVIGPSLSSIFP